MKKNILNQKTPKLWVLSGKTAYMQRIADYVRTGHKWYIQGVSEPEKIFKLWDKLTDVHPVFDDKMRAYRARKEGRPTGRLMFYQSIKKPEQIHWILLIHGELDQLDKSEKWRNAHTRDRVAMTGYELVRITKKAVEKQKPAASDISKPTVVKPDSIASDIPKSGIQKPVWSWRYLPARYEELRDILVYSIRSNHVQDLKRFITTLWGTIGFAGSREQAKALQNLLFAEWKRRNGDKPPPDMPNGFGYTRRKKDAGAWIQRDRKLANAALKAKTDEKAAADTAKAEFAKATEGWPEFDEVELAAYIEQMHGELALISIVELGAETTPR